MAGEGQEAVEPGAPAVAADAAFDAVRGITVAVGEEDVAIGEEHKICGMLSGLGDLNRIRPGEAAVLRMCAVQSLDAVIAHDGEEVAAGQRDESGLVFVVGDEGGFFPGQAIVAGADEVGGVETLAAALVFPGLAVVNGREQGSVGERDDFAVG